MKHDFVPYMSPVFIETGSYGGDGIAAAMKAGFKKIHSIELSDHYYNLCVERYGNEQNVHLHHGDSIEVLPKLLSTINEPVTFWLDGHYCGPDSASGIKAVPLWEELEIIKSHTLKMHTILIDDMRLLRRREAEWKDLPYTIADVESLIMSINPRYSIKYIKGFESMDILVAQV
jgi:hypothetical protein